MFFSEIGGVCASFILKQIRVPIFGTGTVAKPWGQVLGINQNGTKHQVLRTEWEKSHAGHKRTEEISKSKRGLARSKQLTGFVIMLKVIFWFQLVPCLAQRPAVSHLAHIMQR